MRVALLLESDGPGGAETVLLTLAEELRERGHQVIPVGPRRGEGWLGDQFRDRGFSPETFELRHTVDVGCLAGLVRLFRTRQVQVAHSHEFTMATYGAAAASLARVPHVITMHGGRYYAEALRRRMALRWAVRRSMATVAVSGRTAEDLRTTLGLSPDQVQVIPNGRRLKKGEGVKVRQELRLPDGHLLILNVGNLYPVKGQDILLRAVHEVSQDPSLPPVHVAIAGRGHEEEALRALASELGLGARLHLLGHRDDVADLLDAADVFCLPSRSEGLPLALLEAMFAEKAIVASAVGGIPEVIQHQEHGLLCQPGSHLELASALRCVLMDRPLRFRLGEGARNLADLKYSPSAMASAYVSVYLISSVRLS